MALNKEDYIEPRCLLCDVDPESEQAKVQAVPVGRVLEKFDQFLDKNDTDGAKRHLLYWIEEAKNGHDDRGLFTLTNEWMGLARKLGLKEEAVKAAEDTLALAETLKMTGNVTGATAFLNAGTVYKAFGDAAKGLPLFEKAKAIYEANLAPTDDRLPGLYNNMGLALCDLGRFDEAKEAYMQALALTEPKPERAADAAITLLNLANLAEAQHGMLDGNEEIMACLDRAQELLDSETLPHDGYYAFVCEKCAPTFAYYGYFAFHDALLSRARSIYEGT